MKSMRGSIFTLALAALALLAFHSPPAQAQEGGMAAGDYNFVQDRPILFRRTIAASTVALKPWSAGGRQTCYTDSTVFRHGPSSDAVATRTTSDTTEAIPISEWDYPPTFAMRSAAYGSRAMKFNGGAVTAQFGGVDSLVADTLDRSPWVVITIVQDTTSYAFTGSSAGDSMLVGGEISYDGGNTWESLNGTPTRAFHGTTATSPIAVASGVDGLVTALIVAAEKAPPSDRWTFNFECQPTLVAASTTALIINRTLCYANNALIRFIVCPLDATGQYTMNISHWEHR